MAESFLFNIAERVLEKIALLAVEEVRLLFNVENDLEELQDTMTHIKAVLLDAERQQHQNEALRLSIWKLRDLFDDAEDVIDEIECEALRKRVVNYPSTSIKVRCLPSCFVPLAFSSKMGHKIKEINKRIDTIATEWDRFKLVTHQVDNRRVIHRETYSFVNSSDVIGRDEDREKIINLLKEPSDESGNIPVIPIVGIGGLGKTTLAQFVYNDERVIKLFSLRIWVCVSEEFDLRRLLKEMICSVSKKNCDDSQIDILQTQLRSLLNENNFLLVLDDVWNEDRAKWIQFKNLLMSMGNLSRSKIIVTTRSLKVASIMSSCDSYVLKGLFYEDCLTLFTKWAFNDGDERRYPNLMRIGKKIVEKCKGVPLAVRTLGSLLFSKTDEREWILLRDNEIWRLEQSENDILPVLKLSYHYLPSHLQRCLTYLSLFPKDYLYDTDYIIQFWMAYGLLASSNQNEEWEDIGITYFKELWLRCFVQDVTDHGSFYRFKMHDLIHDLTLNLSQRECLTVNRQQMKVIEKVRHLSFSLDSPLGVPQSLKKLKRVRTIVVPPLPFSTENRSIDESFVNACILNFKYLRLLDLSYTLLEELPESIGTLKHLRYLDLSLCRRMRKIPSSICKLQSLLTLRLFGVPLIEVPESLQSLISLRFLEITTDALLLRVIQPGCWSSLQFLFLHKCDRLESIFDGMQHLTSLRRLGIRGCVRLISLPRSLKFLTKLEEINIKSCQKINLCMEVEEAEDQDLHLSLKAFSVLWSDALTDLPRLLLKGSANTLQSIQIIGCKNFEVLPEWLQNLTSLQKLEISYCRKLSSLPEGMDRLTALRLLKIKGCPTLSERCRRDGGADWPKISHVQEVEVDL
ncbi:Leucine-rich repeat containing protein isoform 1 [Theobroma cacao]|uniref:Leucine-rich repeat containing protein isoform 1 n=2 Tax=Theobroma cacao TaxID=3641 RepID=A0A061F0T8_THECC|nr:Leucine-rich repeat containing protein isoform 1 [Theobroma cacao]